MRILLVTEDREYGRALIQALSTYQPGIYGVIGSGNFPEEEMERPDILVLDEFPNELKEEELRERVGCPVLFLREEDYQGPLVTAYKYDSAKEILKSISSELGRKGHILPLLNSEGQTKILAVTGARGGTGRTTLSMGIAAELSVYHEKRTLYLNCGEMDLVEDWCSTSGEGSGSEGGLSRYFYYLESKGKADLQHFIKETSRGVRYFYPSGGKNQSHQLSLEESSRWIEEIKSSSSTDWIIADVSSLSMNLSQCILARADVLCYISNQPLIGKEGKDNQRDREMFTLIQKERTPSPNKATCYIHNQPYPEEEMELREFGERDVPPDYFVLEFDERMNTLFPLWDGCDPAGIFSRRMREIGQWILDRQDWI